MVTLKTGRIELYPSKSPTELLLIISPKNSRNISILGFNDRPGRGAESPGLMSARHQGQELRLRPGRGAESPGLTVSIIILYPLRINRGKLIRSYALKTGIYLDTSGYTKKMIR